MQFVRWATAVVIFASLTSVILPATALATCTVGPVGFVVWPKPDATDVPLDTPIVVGRYYVDGDTNTIQPSLAAADGTPVALEELSRLPPPWKGCGSSEHVFYRPSQKLTAGGKYTLRVSIADKAPSNIGSFTVADRVSVREAPVHPEITYLKVFTNPACVGEQCLAYANLRVELEQPPSQPLWLRLHGSYPLQNTNAWTFYPKGWSEQGDQQPEVLSKIQLSVPLATADDCVDIQIYGVEGRALFEERRCEPTRCAVYNIVAGRNSGGGPGGSPVDVDQVPDGSCDDPPVLNDGSGMVYPSDAGMPSEQTDASAAGAAEVDTSVPSPPAFKHQRASNGCSASAPRSAGASVSVLMTLLLMPALILRRRRALAQRSVALPPSAAHAT